MNLSGALVLARVEGETDSRNHDSSDRKDREGEEGGAGPPSRSYEISPREIRATV